MSLHQIASTIHLAKQGAEKLATGEYFAAASSFCAAIKRAQRLVEDESSTRDEESFSSSSSSDDALLKTKPWFLEALPVLSPELLYNEINVFEHCFVATPGTGMDMFSSSDCELLTAALIYNLALTYHYCGVCGNSQERMTDAMNLYEKASHILQCLDEQNDAETLSLSLAVSNNAASLSLVMRSMKTYKEHCYRLQKTLQQKDDFHGSFFLGNLTMALGTAKTCCGVSPIHKVPLQ